MVPDRSFSSGSLDFSVPRRVGSATGVGSAAACGEVSSTAPFGFVVLAGGSTTGVVVLVGARLAVVGSSLLVDAGRASPVSPGCLAPFGVSPVEPLLDEDVVSLLWEASGSST